jgi:hypothetical protein
VGGFGGCTSSERLGSGRIGSDRNGSDRGDANTWRDFAVCHGVTIGVTIAVTSVVTEGGDAAESLPTRLLPSASCLPVLTDLSGRRVVIEKVMDAPVGAVLLPEFSVDQAFSQLDGRSLGHAREDQRELVGTDPTVSQESIAKAHSGDVKPEAVKANAVNLGMVRRVLIDATPGHRPGSKPKPGCDVPRRNAATKAAALSWIALARAK